MRPRVATKETTTPAAGFIPAATLEQLSDILATLPEDYPNSADALPAPLRAYFDDLRADGVVTLRASDSLTIEVGSIAAELTKDPGYWSAKDNSADVALVVGLNVSRGGVSSSSWVRVYWDSRGGVFVPRYEGRPVFAEHCAPSFYNSARGKFEPLPVGAVSLVMKYAAEMFAGAPVNGDDVARAAWLAASQRVIRNNAREVARGIELAQLSAAHFA